MNEARGISLMLNGLLFEAPEEDRAKINEAVAKIRAVLAEYGDNGLFAVTIIGAEMAAAN